MSPEQVKSSLITPRADLFSAGVVMYEMLTGIKPFAAADISGILYNVVNLQPTAVDKLNPGVPRAVGTVVAKLMTKSPLERYPTAADALKEIERARPPAGASAPGLSTLATPNRGDLTTPLQALEAAAAETDVPLMRRRVPLDVFWGVTLLLAAALAASVLWLRGRVVAVRPVAVMTSEQSDAYESKRRELDGARAFALSGNYDEAVRRYDAYLAKYPQSALALAERDAARRRLVVDMPVDQTITVTKPRPKPPQNARPAKDSSRWDRVKRWFRGQ